MAKRISRPSAKKQAAATKKLIAESQRAAKKDLSEKWRVLRKIGAYNTRETAAMNRLTKHRIREIEKRFKEVQKMKVLVAGKTVRPLSYVQRKTKSGKMKTVLDFTPNFTFVRTKNKTPRTAGIQKTGKGYIVQKATSVKRVTIGRDGEIREYFDKTRSRRKRWRGDDILKLVRMIEDDKLKFRKHDLLTFHSWGNASKQYGFEEDTAFEFAKYVREAEKKMDATTFERFMQVSYVEFVTFREG